MTKAFDKITRELIVSLRRMAGRQGDDLSLVSDAADEIEKLTTERDRCKATLDKAQWLLVRCHDRIEAAGEGASTDGVPPFADGGYGSGLIGEAMAYLKEYVFDPGDDADHEPTEFERAMLEDFVHGLISHEPFFGIIRAKADALAQAKADLGRGGRAAAAVGKTR
jgi:hypothetical protein